MIKEMQYVFKNKLNKVDSETFRNLLAPEIDLVLNEALTLFVKLVGEPRRKEYLGVDTSQRSIEDIRPLIVPNAKIAVNNNVAVLPTDYWYYLKGNCTIESKFCSTPVTARIIPRQHDDNFEDSPFYESSIAWKEVNGTFDNTGIRLYPKGFTIKDATIYYIKRHPYIYNATAYPNGYFHPTHGLLTGFRDCILPIDVCNEIVDIAVLITTGNLQVPDYNIKAQQLKLNQII